MNATTERRLAKLAAAAGSVGRFIPVFCRDDADFEDAFAEKVRWGHCRQEDRPRALPYTHEAFDALREVDAAEWTRWANGEGSLPSGSPFGTFAEWLRVL